MAYTRDREAGHVYPSIHISGNARVILGDVYGLSEEFIDSATRTNFKSSVLRDLEGRSTGRNGSPTLLTSRLSTLILYGYENMVTSIHKVRNYESQLKRCANRIAVKQTIFQSTLLSVIGGYVEHEIAHQMLEDTKHPTWSEQGFLDYLETKVGVNHTAINKALETMSLDLDALATIFQNCMILVNKIKQEISLPVLREVRKVRLGRLLDDEQIAARMTALKESTDDFRILLKQASPQEQRTHPTVVSGQTKIRLGRFRRIQEAANDLHRSFSLACTRHTTHQTRLKIQANAFDAERVQFSLIFEQNEILPLQPPGASSLQLTIQSEITGTITSRDPLPPYCSASPPLRKSRKRSCEEGQGEEQQTQSKNFKPPKRVGFATFAAPKMFPVRPQKDDFPNFCTHRDFCLHVKQLVKRGWSKDHLLGYLDSPGCSKHLIYLSNHAHTTRFAAKPSLQTTGFAQLYTCSTNRLSRSDIASLSKQLAVAALQYHATPWLEESWDGNHIFVERKSVTDIDRQSSDDQVYEPLDPYLDVSIKSDKNTGRTPIASRSRTLIREWTLFSLGVMLLELVYRQPISQKRIDRDVDTNEHNTTYYTAERLQQSVAEEMGDVYAEIVRKCIQCDFGHGADLSTNKLQEAFYEDVVQKLEDMQTQFRQLGL